MKPPFKNVLCPTDLSPTGDAAVALAFALAGEGGVVHLLHVWEPAYVLSPLDATPVVMLPSSPESDAAHEKKVHHHLRRLVPESALAHDVRTEITVLRDGDPTGTIRREAERLGAEVIVMGTHGRTGIGRALMGSVATDVLKTAKVPVVLVREPAGRA